MSKPFSIQSPETIAKEYGGNKQRIAQAMQTGVVDPTAGVLAAMFIDRMRGAQSQEAAQQPTVAQQAFAPTPPPGGGMAPPPGGMAPPAPPMGGMGPPPGGMPPAPPMGAPPMGAPPMGAPPMGAPPAPPMGMADGGLAALPIPESMFDEPVDSGYADGGMVAFAGAGLTSTPDYSTLEQLMAEYGDEARGREEYGNLYQPKRQYADRANQMFEGILSEEGQKKRRDEDKYFALAQLGATMASTPGSLLQAASAGINRALPGLQESSKERRAEQRDALRQLAADEGATNAEQREFAKYMMGRKDKQADIGKDLAQLTSGDARARAQLKSAEGISAADNAARLAAARIGASGGSGSKPDPVMLYAQSIYENAKKINATLPLAKTMQEYRANPNAYRKDDSYLRQKAYEKALSARYDDTSKPLGAMSPEDLRRNVQSGRGGGSQPAGNRIAFESLE